MKKSKDNLFIGKYEKHRIPELVLGQHSRELFSRFTNAFPVVAVDDKYQSLSVLKVMPPKGSDLVLTADVPYRETNVLVLNRLNIKAYHLIHK